MKKSLFLPLLLVVMAGFPVIPGAAMVIQNPDQPAKGIWKFNPVPEWSVDEAGDDIIASAAFINISQKGTIYFFDERNSRVIALSQQGRKVLSFGREGEGPGEIKFAWDMSLRGDRIVVHDTESYHLFSLKGDYIKTIRYSGESEGLIDPTMMLKSVEDRDGQSLWIVKFKNHSETFLKKMARPVRLVAQGGGIRLRVRDINIVTGLHAACGDNRIVFGQSGTYRLYVADYSGRILSAFGVTGRSRPEIPQEYKESRFTRLKMNGSLLDRGMVRQLVRCIPERGPYFNKILLHDSGLIFVMLPEYNSRSARCFDVFSPDGKYLYRGILAMPDGLAFNTHAFALSGNTLVMFTGGPDSEPAMMKFKIQIPPAE